MNIREFIVMEALNAASTIHSTAYMDRFHGYPRLEYRATAAQCCELFRESPDFERERVYAPDLIRSHVMGAALRELTKQQLGRGEPFVFHPRVREWALTHAGASAIAA